MQCFVACSSVVVDVRAQALAYLKLSLWYQQRTEAGQAAQPGRCCPLACQVQCDDAGGCSLMRLDGLTSTVSWLDGCDDGLRLCCNSKVLLCICLFLRHLMHRPAGSDKDPRAYARPCKAGCGAELLADSENLLQLHMLVHNWTHALLTAAGSEGEDQEGSEGNQPASESEELA